MAAEHAQYANPSEYISHHLTFATKQVGDGSFWALNVDSIVVSIILGIVGLAFFYWIAKGSTTGVPNKRQAFVEILFLEIDKSVRGIFHGDPNKFVGPVALTTFVWVLLMNAMDLLPVDWITMLTGALGFHHGFRIVPSADDNFLDGEKAEDIGHRCALVAEVEKRRMGNRVGGTTSSVFI
jgi:F-type H+-transporting ATPase subunit a